MLFVFIFHCGRNSIGIYGTQIVIQMAKRCYSILYTNADDRSTGRFDLVCLSVDPRPLARTGNPPPP